jgi:hypothetical protein
MDDGRWTANSGGRVDTFAGVFLERFWCVQGKILGAARAVFLEDGAGFREETPTFPHMNAFP